MTMTERWTGSALFDGYDRQEKRQKAGTRVDPALKAVLEKPDDRLLRDAGLTRDGVLGATGRFWFDWARRSDPWTL